MVGEGVLQDYEEGIKWFRLAAEQGDALAQASLALAYGQGHGVDYDLVVAYMWFNISTVSGLKADQKMTSEQIKQIKDDRDIAANRMTSEQIKEAQKLSRECVKKNYKNCASTETTPDQNTATQEVASSKTNLTLPPCKGNNWQKYHNCTGSVSLEGAKYVGEFQNGAPEGQGTLTYANGDIWIGEMKGGDAHGYGTYTHRNGDKYIGEMKRSEGSWGPSVPADGEATMTFAGERSGERYVGEFKNGKYHGFGVYTFPNGDKYTGEWKNGFQHGQGYWSYANQPTQQGYYESGQLKQSKQIQNEGIGMRILRAVHGALEVTSKEMMEDARIRRQQMDQQIMNQGSKNCTVTTGPGTMSIGDTAYNVRMNCR
jgi:hypothetical protein